MVRLLAVVLSVAAAVLGAVAVPAAHADARSDAVALGREAYRYGVPLLEFLRVRAENTSVRAPDGRGNAPLNALGNTRGLAGPDDRTVVAPNTDTLYSIAHLDLGRGPVVLSLPDLGRRYVVFQLLDPYTNTIGYVGTRTTGTGAGRFAITWTRRPGRRVRGARVVPSPSRRVWVIGRTVVDGEADLPRARALTARFRLGPRRRFPRAPGRPRTVARPTGLAFLDALGRALAANPPPARDRAVLRRLAAVGVGPGRRPSRADLPAAVRDGLREGVEREAAELPGRARTDVLARALAAGGWFTADPRIGDYGTAYELRAQIALVGLGANTPEEATYPIALADAGGRLLDGGSRYRITFAPGRTPPVRAFWSLTMYDLAGFLVPNPARRYAVGDTHPPLVRRADGAVVVAVQRERPAEADVNWLPARAGPFRLNLRLYWPERAALTGAWRPPPVERLP